MPGIYNGLYSCGYFLSRGEWVCDIELLPYEDQVPVGTVRQDFTQILIKDKIFGGTQEYFSPPSPILDVAGANTQDLEDWLNTLNRGTFNVTIDDDTGGIRITSLATPYLPLTCSLIAEPDGEEIGAVFQYSNVRYE